MTNMLDCVISKMAASYIVIISIAHTPLSSAGGASSYKTLHAPITVQPK